MRAKERKPIKTKQMLAALYTRRGEARDVLGTSLIPVPEPGPGEVLVRVTFSGVNPSDWKARARTALPLEGFQIPHQDGSGVITAVGTGVSADRVGERVWIYHACRGTHWGTAAGFVPVRNDQAVALPANVSLKHGAMLGIPYMTAATCLRASTQAIAGRTVLVQGGAGSVGSAAIQLARWLRARSVIATARSADKRNLAREAGAHKTIDYSSPRFGDELVEAAPDGIDHVLELALATKIGAVSQAINLGAEIVVYGADEGDALLPTRTLFNSGPSIRFLLVYNVPPAEEVTNALLLNDMFASGIAPLLETTVYPLERIVEAHLEAESIPFGRILLEVSPDV